MKVTLSSVSVAQGSCRQGITQPALHLRHLVLSLSSAPRQPSSVPHAQLAALIWNEQETFPFGVSSSRWSTQIPLRWVQRQASRSASHFETGVVWSEAQICLQASAHRTTLASSSCRSHTFQHSVHGSTQLAWK